MTRQKRTGGTAAGSADILSDIEDEAHYQVIVSSGCVLRPGESILKGKLVKANRDYVHVIGPA